MEADSFIITIVSTAGDELPVVVTRKRVKNVNFHVRTDGSVAVSVPARMSSTRAREIIDLKAAWIFAHVERFRARAEAEMGAEPEGGMAGAAGEAPDLVPLWGKLVAAADALPEGTSGTDNALDKLYRSELAQALPAVTQRFEAMMHVRASRWQLRAMKTRWGSCTPRTQAIRINTRLAAYPPCCLEYVVAHELCHLLEPSHNQRFHTLLGIYFPEVDAAKALLKRSPRAAARTPGAS